MQVVLDELVRRTDALVEALRQRVDDLDAPSLLPGWSRLTIACHLRYGAEAMRQMTIDALAGRRASYYPSGRAAQRPGTLVPRDGEDSAAVVSSLARASDLLHETWASVTAWDTPVVEPDDNPDLGHVVLHDLPRFRLTEIEVHGTDLGIGLPDWSDVLVDAALALRLHRLSGRMPQAPGAWLLRVVGGRHDGMEVLLGDGSAPEVIDASDRDLFALTLGRVVLSDSFAAAYPGP